MTNLWDGKSTPPNELAPAWEVDPRAGLVEDYADQLMADCKDLGVAMLINTGNDLYDGDLLPKLIHEIAKWDGSSFNAAIHMKAMFNLLADEFQKIAEREV